MFRHTPNPSTLFHLHCFVYNFFFFDLGCLNGLILLLQYILLPAVKGVSKKQKLEIKLLTRLRAFRSVTQLVVSDSLWPHGTVACQASLSTTNSWSLLKLMSIESMMPLQGPMRPTWSQPLLILLFPYYIPVILVPFSLLKAFSRVFPASGPLHTLFLLPITFLHPGFYSCFLLKFQILCYLLLLQSHSPISNYSIAIK